MKIKTTLHIYFCKFAWEEIGKFVPFAFPVEPCEDYTFVCKQEIELEVPEDFDPRTQQIAALEQQKQKVMADYQKSVTEINDRIFNLLALEYTA